MAMYNLKEEEKWIKHYSSSHKILLVGEGDFSFAVCLATAFGSAHNIIATSFDSEGEVTRKFVHASRNLNRLKDMGCTILHEVDANTMGINPKICWRSFDKIVFNFPHAGFTYSSEHHPIQIMLHQGVVKGFLRSARDMLGIIGEVHVTHKTAYPFDRWELENLALDVGLRLVEKADFSLYDYPGYINKKGSDLRSDETFPVGQCKTFKFTKF